jgi:hypothetical protein
MDVIASMVSEMWIIFCALLKSPASSSSSHDHDIKFIDFRTVCWSLVSLNRHHHDMNSGFIIASPRDTYAGLIHTVFMDTFLSCEVNRLFKPV